MRRVSYWGELAVGRIDCKSFGSFGHDLRHRRTAGGSGTVYTLAHSRRAGCHSDSAGGQSKHSYSSTTVTAQCELTALSRNTVTFLNIYSSDSWSRIVPSKLSVGSAEREIFSASSAAVHYVDDKRSPLW